MIPEMREKEAFLHPASGYEKSDKIFTISGHSGIFSSLPHDEATGISLLRMVY